MSSEAISPEIASELIFLTAGRAISSNGHAI